MVRVGPATVWTTSSPCLSWSWRGMWEGPEIRKFGSHGTGLNSPQRAAAELAGGPTPASPLPIQPWVYQTGRMGGRERAVEAQRWCRDEGRGRRGVREDREPASFFQPRQVVVSFSQGSDPSTGKRSFSFSRRCATPVLPAPKPDHPGWGGQNCPPPPVHSTPPPTVPVL